ncbi:hypothetical protein J2S49_000902 [Arcanobacterium wilhelmae]|uniref:Uncharacterized protein n=1 Tax=Arcanobacterium wilhelmae TaxID=1803177 RepID=A0ABT9NC87_9ACTO|nr:hypothetical protein [Arcanobacterium wilhelmae]MDP9800826.1 hypothetical protein [Arcanobacterium wilhelmae]WFN90201.1 hypothetical protein P8A24_08450 [Arcanobacterium wilhelmae]
MTKNRDHFRSPAKLHTAAPSSSAPASLKDVKFQAVAVATAALAALVACSPAHPPKPAPKPHASAVAPTRNPYQAGAEPAWRAKLPEAPEALTFDNTTKTLVVLSTHNSLRRLTGYAVTGKNRALPTWRYYLPQGSTATSLDAAAGSVYLTIGPDAEHAADAGAASNDAGTASDGAGAASTQASPSASSSGPSTSPSPPASPSATSSASQSLDATASAAPASEPASGDGRASRSDLVILSARTGSASFTWSTDNSLGGDVPAIVGASEAGLGVVGVGRTSSVAALVGASGTVENSVRTYFPPTLTLEPQVSPGLVRLQTNKSGNGEFVQFPSLGRAEGNECWAATDGTVCVAAEGSLHVEAGGKHTDPTPGADATPSAPVSVQPGNPTAKPGASASPATSESATPASGDAVGLNPESSGVVVVEWNSSGHAVSVTAAPVGSAALGYALAGVNADVTSRELKAALLERVEPAETGEAAVLSDGKWLPKSQWKAGGDALPLGAPFAMVGKNIVDLTSGKPANAQGTTGIVGSGSAHNMFFQWDGRELIYLRPLGE